LKPHAIARGRGLKQFGLGVCVTIAGLGLACSAPAFGSSGGTTYEPPAVETPPTAGIKVTRHVRRGDAIKVKGRLKVRRRMVKLQRRIGSRWETVDRVRTGRRGGFKAAWQPKRAGSYRLRLRYRARRARAASVAERLPRVYVYRRSNATWYGGSLYGNHTACGQTLTRDTIGVAHKTLPCGTKIRFRYHGHSAVAKVIDRGPYRAGYDWDLTEALAEQLGFRSVGAGPLWSSR
jgi:peptidoglycan lytic transglycosylase